MAGAEHKREYGSGTLAVGHCHSDPHWARHHRRWGPVRLAEAEIGRVHGRGENAVRGAPGVRRQHGTAVGLTSPQVKGDHPAACDRHRRLRGKIDDRTTHRRR